MTLALAVFIVFLFEERVFGCKGFLKVELTGMLEGLSLRLYVVRDSPTVMFLLNLCFV